MSLEMRRKNKAAATAGGEKKTKTKSNRVSGTMRSIAIGRSYLEYKPPIDDEGRPFFRSIFDAQGNGAKPIGKDVNKDRVLSTSLFLKHTNYTVAKQVLGMSFRPKVWRMLVEGIFDQALSLVEAGYTVKTPNFVTARAVKRGARKARNPRTGESVDVKAHIALSAKPTRSAKAYLSQGGI